MFNQQFARRLANGQLRLDLRTTTTPRTTHEPPDTESNTYNLVDRNGEWMGIVHAYIRSDGSIGASGQYDPKCLVVGRTLYTL
jgi:hypothetical protein